jgi:uric acid-xanthine permease
VQNNGVIAITRCANRGAGRWCCAFLILFGVLGKISGVFLASTSQLPSFFYLFFSDDNSVPNPVLGGVTTFLFASVIISGVRVLSYNKFTRRDRFVLAAAFSFGIGDLLAPGIFTHLFDGVDHPNSGLTGLFDSITIVLSTPCKPIFPRLRHKGLITLSSPFVRDCRRGAEPFASARE